jgi:hypothetical protein
VFCVVVSPTGLLNPQKRAAQNRGHELTQNEHTQSLTNEFEKQHQLAITANTLSLGVCRRPAGR